MEPLKKVERLQQIGTLMAEHGRHAIIAGYYYFEAYYSQMAKPELRRRKS